MRSAILVMLVIFTVLFIAERSQRRSKMSPETRNVINWYNIRAASLDASAGRLLRAVTRHRPAAEVQQRFLETRLAYKQLELMVEYFNPVTAKAINGPNLPEAEPDNPTVVIEPEGLQVLEEMLFPAVSAADTAAMRMETQRLLANIHRLKITAAGLLATDAHIFDAIRLELLRITALGISGFDSPVAQYSIPEAAAALGGVKEVWLFYQDGLAKRDKKVFEETTVLFSQAVQALQQAEGFDRFSRMRFITGYLNPLAEKMRRSREALQIPYRTGPQFFREEAAHAFEKGAFNPAFYSPEQAAVAPAAPAVALGRKLFYDPVLSGNGSRSCGSCHQPAKAFTDGLRVPASLNEQPVQRNTPTLLNAALQPSQFYDQRVAYLEDQVEDVVNNPSEMHGSLEPAAALLMRDSTYRQLFRSAFGNDITAAHIRKSIAAYIRSLVELNSPFDAYMRGDERALDAAAVRGFDLFMGKAKCGTCHFVPLFNGNVPPAFQKAEAEVLGVPAAGAPTLDPDEGKYRLHRIDHQRFAFKTPTLRNIALTAPYMHNGVYNSLEEVMEFYNHGGGAGIGIRLGNQTLPPDSLHLSKAEQQDIIAFMQSLSSPGGNSK